MRNRVGPMLFNFGLLALCALLPAHGTWPYVTPVVVLMMVGALLGPSSGHVLSANRHLVWLPVSLLVFAMALAWSPEPLAGLDKIFLRSPLLFVPLAFALRGPSRELRHRAKWVLAGSVTLVSAILVFRGLYLLQQTGKLIVYIDFSPWVHPAYLSILVAIAMFIVVIDDVKRAHPIVWAKVCALLILFSSLMALSARSQIIATLLVGLFGLIVTVFKKWGVTRGLLPLGLVLVMLLPMGFNWLQNNDRMHIAINEFSAFDANAPIENGAGTRFILWKESVRLILEKPWGYGAGHGKTVLLNQLKAQGHDALVAKGLNSHNQYLGDALSGGLQCFLATLLMLIVPLVHAWKQQNLLATMSIAIFGMSMLTESLLERQAGVAITALFITLFTYVETPQKQ